MISARWRAPDALHAIDAIPTHWSMSTQVRAMTKKVTDFKVARSDLPKSATSMVTMKAKQMVSKFDLDVLKQPLTFNIIITIIPVGRVMYIYTALTGVDRWIGNWEDWTSCALAHWMLPVSQQKAVCGKFPAHLMMRKDGRTADSGDLFVSMNGLVVYLMFLFCVVWLTKDFTLSQENVKLCSTVRKSNFTGAPDASVAFHTDA